MKDFVKMTLAVICGLFIIGIIGFFLLISTIGAIASFGSSTPVIPRSGVLNMDLSKIAFTEQAKDIDPMSVVKGDDTRSVGLWDAVRVIKKASEDPAVQYIFLRPEGTMIGMAQIEELRKALVEFRNSGKAVVAYVENPSSGAYYLASAADKVYMGNYAGGTNTMVGIGSQMVFLKDLLDKFGVNVQLIRHGKYKSAGETYIKSEPSPENLEQTKEMIMSIWSTMATSICESRGISIDKFNDLIDNLKLGTPKDFLDASLVDELLTKEELKAKLAGLAEKEKYSDVSFIPFTDYIAANTSVQTGGSKDKIAIIFAEGNIIDGYGKQEVAGDRFASLIADVRADSTVKAVVFRVASPGGSVVASDKIKTEIDLMRKVKPVIASYGNYAASGGYWISNSCDKVYSDATTLTGSIGVFSMVPDFSKTAKNVLNVNVTNVGSNKHSDMFSLMKPLDVQEYDYLQKSVNDIYEAFLENVSAGRGMTVAAVDEIAQGRVWSGADAKRLGLVDEIGTLSDAVDYAAIAGGNDDLSSWQIATYPQPISTLELLLESLTGSSNVLAGTPFESVENAFKDWNWNSSERVFARMPYLIEIK